MLKPLKKRTLAEDIIGSIKQLVDSGELKSGDRLPGERELSDQLQVSRASVREALRALSFAGIISIKPGDGTYLNESAGYNFTELLNKKLGLFIRKNDYLILMEARRVLETQLARFSAERATPEIIASLEENVKKMAEDLDDPDIFVREDVKFHVTVSEAAENEILNLTMEAVRELLLDVQKLVAETPGLRPKSLRFHREILESIKKGDSEEAAKVMDEHLANVDECVRECLKDELWFDGVKE